MVNIKKCVLDIALCFLSGISVGLGSIEPWTTKDQVRNDIRKWSEGIVEIDYIKQKIDVTKNSINYDSNEMFDRVQLLLDAYHNLTIINGWFFSLHNLIKKYQGNKLEDEIKKRADSIVCSEVYRWVINNKKNDISIKHSVDEIGALIDELIAFTKNTLHLIVTNIFGVKRHLKDYIAYVECMINIIKYPNFCENEIDELSYLYRKTKCPILKGLIREALQKIKYMDEYPNDSENEIKVLENLCLRTRCPMLKDFVRKILQKKSIM